MSMHVYRYLLFAFLAWIRAFYRSCLLTFLFAWTHPHTTSLHIHFFFIPFLQNTHQAYRIDHLFTKVITNPAEFDPRGRLNVVRFHGLDKTPHGCPLPCQPNLCKGQELLKLIDSNAWDQVVYMGDSTNDFCPSTRLQRNDVVLARRGLLLEKEIKENKDLVKANVVYWDNAVDVLEATQSILGSFQESTASSLPSPLRTERSSAEQARSTVESSDSKRYAQAVKA